jgi:hypothetical protein
MPDKPLWYGRLEEVIVELEALPSPLVDRATLELVLHVGQRRAQQILAPLVRQTIGSSGVAKREEVIEHLRRLAAGNPAYYERQRRKRLRSILEQIREAARQPQVLVEAPTSIKRQDFDTLPSGIELSPGRILITEFRTPEEALQKLLALAMAVGNDPLLFENKILEKR